METAFLIVRFQETSIGWQPISPRGTGHNEYAVYSERKEDWENNMIRLARKFDTARNWSGHPLYDANPNARIGIISVGSNDPAVCEAQDRLQTANVETSYMRLRALPINQQVKDFVAAHDQVYVVENNFMGSSVQFCAQKCRCWPAA